MNDISNVQNNMGVKVECYYLLLQKNLKLLYFHGFNHKKVTIISQKKEWITINQMYSQNMLSNEFFFFSNFLNASNFIIIKRQKEKWCYT